MNRCAAAPGAGATLDQWLEWQLAVHPQEIRLGLDRVTAVADALGLRAAPPLTLTVGGTNGKGSATRLAADLLHRMGSRVGRFSSPHLHRYNERIEIDGQPLSDAQIIAAFVAVDGARGDVPLTYFEFGTLAALWCFREQVCDAQVLEVGLGGRLDAVNLLDADAALVTSIGTDHQDWLGHGRDAVGREKAGIFRHDRVAVCADPAPPPGFVAYCHEHAVTPLQLGDDFWVSAAGGDTWQLQWAGEGSLCLPVPPQLPGVHQWRNAAGVLVMLRALGRIPTPEVAAAALRAWSLPGRAECIGRHVLDVAHNSEAVTALVDTLAHRPQPVHLILGMLADKPCETVMAMLAPRVSNVVLVGTPPPRGLTAAALARRLGNVVPNARIADSVAAALRQWADKPGTILVCGSFAVVADARASLLRGGVDG